MQRMNMTHGCCVYKRLSYGRTQTVLTINSDQKRELVLTLLDIKINLYQKQKVRLFMAFTVWEKEGPSFYEEQGLFTCLPLFLTYTGINPLNPVLEVEEV